MIHFMGIGAQKAGTTWIYEHLRNHPGIRFPAGKEIHFWDLHLDRGETWWLSLFPNMGDGARQGEITPAYAILDLEHIGRVRSVAPDLRIFYSLRNPIERAWSSARMAVARAEMTIDEASNQWFLDDFHSAGSMRRGMYRQCLDNWLAVFPEEQLEIVFFDDIARDPRKVLRTICAHIGVDDSPYDGVDDSRLMTPVFEGSKGRIRPVLLAELRSMYQDEINQLSKRFARDLTHWLLWDNNDG